MKVMCFLCEKSCSFKDSFAPLALYVNSHFVANIFFYLINYKIKRDHKKEYFECLTVTASKATRYMILIHLLIIKFMTSYRYLYINKLII